MKICWFTTGKDKDAYILFRDVLEAIDGGAIEGSVAVLFLNREKHESEYSDMIRTCAEERSIPVVALSTTRFLRERNLSLSTGRGYFDAEVLDRIRQFEFDIIFLAGYMLIVSPVIFTAFPVFNIHPSLPGEYKGRWDQVINRVIDDRKRSFGAMVHLVEEVLNEGPPVAYARTAPKEREIRELYRQARAGDGPARIRLFNAVRTREFAIERPLIIQTLSLMSKGIIQVEDGAVFHRGVRVTGGVDVTSEVLERQGKIE
jgi:folate-dependent phosphoribosylglycinamide formyltransferase PurN